MADDQFRAPAMERPSHKELARRYADLSKFEEGRQSNPLTKAQQMEHAGEYVARSLDGTRILAFAATLKELKIILIEDHSLTLADVAFDVVDCPQGNKPRD